MNYINKIYKDIYKNITKNLTKVKKMNLTKYKNVFKQMDKKHMDKVLLSFAIGLIGILGISKVAVEATSDTPEGSYTVTKYNIENDETSKFMYNKEGKLYESKVYYPGSKKVKTLKYFYQNTGKLNSLRTYDKNGKVNRFDSWYNVNNHKEKIGEKAHSIVYDKKQHKIAKEIAFTEKGKVKAVGKFIEPIKRGKLSITSGFGSGRAHTGIDMAYSGGGNTYGKPIYASNAGKVVTVEKHSNAGYGHYVVIDHGNGIRTLYGHMSKVNVHVGQIVWKNQKIGAIGTTGMSTGPHIHFEYRKHNIPINGINLIKRAIFYLR